MRKKLLIVVIFILASAYLSPMAANLIINTLPQENSETIYTNTDSYREATLKDGDYIYFGSYNNEAVLWNVIDDKSNSATLFSDKILCFKSFDAKSPSCQGHEKSDVQKFGTADYNYSSIKTWLNSKSDKVIYENAVPSEKNIFMGINGYDSEAGFLSAENFTQFQSSKIESVFLLSKKQIKEIPQKQRIKSATKSAIKNNESPFIIFPNMKLWYWTSSDIQTNTVSVCTVTSSGNFYKALAFDSATGVCPAIKLNTKTMLVSKGQRKQRKSLYSLQGG